MKFRDPHQDFLMDEHVFVFGSNEGGRHGAGAAHYAYNLGIAKWNVGFGFCNDEGAGSFAIPTKDWQIETLSLTAIENYVKRFLAFAKYKSKTTFYLTPIGTGLAGYTHDEIAPMFKNSPDNVLLPPEWKDILQDD